MRQIEGEEVGLLFDATDDDPRLAKVGLRVAWRMGQRHEHLTPPPFTLSDVILHNGVAAREPMLIHCPTVDTQYRREGRSRSSTRLAVWRRLRFRP